MRASARALGVALVDACAVVSGASVLWLTAGTTVVTGSGLGLLLCLVVSTGLLIGRSRFVGSRPSYSPAAQVIETVVQAVPTLSAAAAWILSGSYFLGWVATYAAVYAVVLQSAAALIGSRSRSRPQDWLTPAVLGGLGIGLLTATASVWSWPVLIGTFATVAVFVLISGFLARTIQEFASHG